MHIEERLFRVCGKTGRIVGFNRHWRWFNWLLPGIGLLAIMKSYGDGPTLCGKNLYGSISGQRHGPIYGNSSPVYYSNLVPPMSHQELGEKTLLFLIDALYGAFSGGVVVQSGGRLSPGAGLGTLHLKNSLVLGGHTTGFYRLVFP